MQKGICVRLVNIIEIFFLTLGTSVPNSTERKIKFAVSKHKEMKTMDKEVNNKDSRSLHRALISSDGPMAACN
ncbi:unnamed protein product [Ilex paraguariensis]|uniref:Uncharacterized protein n=1 Tax=Ilex paraguariensis TaxID=185542 RepID=A0ABC8RZ85_9AQUA